MLFRSASPTAVHVSDARVRARARLAGIPLKNRRFWAAAKLGVVDRGAWPPDLVRTEVAVVRVGPVELICVPGELYPEIAVGGVECPDGADFPGPPVEVPPLRSISKAPLKAVIGLANDEIGYIIPRTQWDELPPFTYGQPSAPYGEVNSLGPDAGPVIHAALKSLLEEEW